MSMTFTIPAQGPFDFAASRQFLAGFEPSKRIPDDHEPIRLGLLSEPAFKPYGVEITAAPNGVRCRLVGNVDPAAAQRQIAHIFSLDVDGRGFDRVLAGDTVLGEISRQIGILRPVLKLSPYEAAAWAIISARITMKQASVVNDRLRQELGTRNDLGDATVFTFPHPQVLMELQEFRGLFGRKPEYLRALGEAALEGDLDAERLQAMSVPDALRHCQTLKGIGPFGAELMVVRAIGTVDHLPANEGRLLDAARIAYDLPGMTAEDLQELSQGWRPFRTWAVVLLRAWYETITDERGGPSVA